MGRLNIFTECERMFSYIQKLADSDVHRQLGLKVYDVIMNGEFTRYKEMDKFLKYLKYSDKVTATKMGITEVNLRKIKSKLTGEAYNLLGDDIFELIYDGEEKEVKKRLTDFDVITDNRKSCELFPKEVVEAINRITCEEKTYSLNDCLPELSFLYWIMPDRLLDIASELDLERLQFLLKALDGDTNGADRIQILRVLKRDITKAKLTDSAKKAFVFPPKRTAESEEN